MKKDKEWLRKESKKHYYLKDLGVSSEPKIMAREIENLIDQLDEPEQVVPSKKETTTPTVSKKEIVIPAVKDTEWFKEELRKIISKRFAPDLELDNEISMLIDELDDLINEKEPTFLNKLTRLFKKHGYDHLGQVALALEHDLEITINKKLPEVPQFVADWIEKRKDDFKYSYDAVTYLESCVWYDEAHVEYEVYEWLPENLLTFCKAWELGYTIEPPKLLTVIVKDYDKTIMTKKIPVDEVNKMMEGLE